MTHHLWLIISEKFDFIRIKYKFQRLIRCFQRLEAQKLISAQLEIATGNWLWYWILVIDWDSVTESYYEWYYSIVQCSKVSTGRIFNQYRGNGFKNIVAAKVEDSGSRRSHGNLAASQRTRDESEMRRILRKMSAGSRWNNTARIELGYTTRLYYTNHCHFVQFISRLSLDLIITTTDKT